MAENPPNPAPHSSELSFPRRMLHGLAIASACGIGTNFDEFFYWPTRPYVEGPDESLGGSVQRLGDWAYLHE